MKDKTYLAIDFKSFYASVECIKLGLDPLTTNLVVADERRTEKTICLAVSPSLKAYGISGRPRLFEVIQAINMINAMRLRNAPGHVFTGSSCLDPELKSSPELSLDYIVACPKMADYIEYSTGIYGNVYLKHVAPDDIFVYSIDEVFIDITRYLSNITARDFAARIVLDILKTTGITATAGLGTNPYLAKVAMDIVAKHISPDENGVRIAELDENTYRRALWSHRPITDFWRVGRGYARRLEDHGLFTMGDVARCSTGKPTDCHNEALLYKLFGVNAELLIDHAWGWEPCTIADIKAYKPSSKSLHSGQTLPEPNAFDLAKLIALEMTEMLVRDLVAKGLVTNQLELTVGYDTENLKDAEDRRNYRGVVTTDYLGRAVPKHAHGTVNLGTHSSSTAKICEAISDLFIRIVDDTLLVRRIIISANNLINESSIPQEQSYEQLDLFTDYEAAKLKREQEEAALDREKSMQKAILEISRKYGNNAILKGMNLLEGARTMERNRQIGGHSA